MGEREEREEACRAGRGRGRLVWRAGFVGASRAGAGRPGGRASRVGMGTVSLSRFQMQMWRGGARGGSYVPTDKQLTAEGTIFTLHQQSASHLKAVMFSYHLMPWLGC